MTNLHAERSTMVHSRETVFTATTRPPCQPMLSSITLRGRTMNIATTRPPTNAIQHNPPWQNTATTRPPANAIQQIPA